MTEKLSDFPKIYCPFVRKTFKVNKEDWKKYGHALQLRSPNVYLVVNEVNPGYEWVFEDPDTIAVEKLDGTNIKIETANGFLITLQNRKTPINPLQIIKGKTFIIEGVFRSIGKGYIKEDGVQAGELIGPKLQSNPLELDYHEWYPFDRAIKYLKYRSFHEHDRTFDNWSLWFKDWLHSRLYTKRRKDKSRNIFAEGVVFYNLKRKAAGKKWMAKLRRDMFDWYYENIEIFNYSKNL